MTELIDIIIQAVDDATATFESIVNSAEEAAASITGMGDATGNVDSTPIQETKTQTEETGTQADETTTAFDNLNNVIQGLAGAEAFSSIADGLMAAADAAGTYEDSMMRAGLEAEGAGISADTMSSTISHLSDVTGRAGGQIRESFITATARGITDMSSFEKMMEGAGAQATLFGTDIETMGNKFSGLAFNANLMPKALKETGITMDELATAMGMTGATADEVKEKWSELDANQRAAILGTAASMNEGEDANAAYKESWAGLQEQIETGKGRLLRLVGEVLLPVLIPAFEAAVKVIDWLGDTFSAIMDGPLGGFISIIGSLGAGILLAVPAIAAITAAVDLFKLSLWPAITASWELLAPWLPFIAIGIAIAAIIYEIGKAFGWWTDVGSMIDAIGAGLQRLWSAFINNPDVQAFIQAMSDAFVVLWDMVSQAGQAVLDFFGINESGNFDIVRALIDGIGQAWDLLKIPINSIIQVVQTVIDVFSLVASGQMDIFTAIMTIWNSIVINFGPIVQTIGSLVLNFASTLWTYAIQAGTNFLNGIITYVSQLPGSMLTQLIRVVSSIASAGAKWVAIARVRANLLVLGVISYLRQLPGRVYSALLSVVSRIVSAGQQWVSSAKQKASDVVNGAYNTLSNLPGKVASALGGVVDAIVAPFKKAYEDAKGWWDKITSLDLSFGGEAAYGGETAMSSGGQAFNINTGEYVVSESGPLVIEDNVNISLDLQKVPSTINTDQLISALQDRSVLSAIAGNRDFQSIDANVKKRISLRNARRG